MHLINNSTFYIPYYIYKKGFDVHTPKPKNFTN